MKFAVRLAMTIVLTIIVVAISLYIYAHVTGTTWTNSIEQETLPKKLCQWGSWLPCNEGKQTRYEKNASDEQNAFECGEVRQMEHRECDQMCNKNYAPVCACTDYDMDGVCQANNYFSNVCELGPDTNYEAGLCRKANEEWLFDN